MTTSDLDVLARTVWDYHHMGHRLDKADCIIALGSHDTRVAARAAELYLEGQAPLLVCTGRLGSLTKGVWTRPEAEVFAEVAMAKGVPRERILVESCATNTGENVAYSRELLRAKGARVQTVIAVQKPYMERRTYATFCKRWPDVEVMVTSPQLSFDDYPTAEITKDQVIHIMVGDLQRIMEYGRTGFQIPQEVPAPVKQAYDRLVEMGYTNHLIPPPRP
jgi:uncharacterized SAM-binding protein YcdF (DUF218 family)